MTPEELDIAYGIAKAFHESYERQAPAYRYKTREASAVPWEDVPQQNKLLMVAVVADLLDKGVIQIGRTKAGDREASGSGRARSSPRSR